MKASVASIVLCGASLLLFCVGAPAATFAARSADQMEVSRSVTGDWTAQRAGTTLTVRFERNHDVWRGWFVSKKDGSLFPLKSVVVGRDTVAFTFDSDPALKFNLLLGKDGTTLSGDAELADGLVLPYMFKREVAE